MKSSDLCARIGEVAIIVDDVISDREALLTARLGREDATSLLLGLGVALQQAANLGVLVTVDDQDSVDIGPERRFNQQGHNDQLIIAASLFCLFEHGLLDAWVQDSFKATSRAVIGKHELSQGGSVQCPVVINYCFAKRLAYLIKCRLTRHDDFARDDVGIDDGGAELGEQVSDRPRSRVAWSGRCLLAPAPTGTCPDSYSKALRRKAS